MDQLEEIAETARDALYVAIDGLPLLDAITAVQMVRDDAATILGGLLADLARNGHR